MNERIKQLVKQAEQYAIDNANEGEDEDYGYSLDDDFQEKFAELIIRECVNQAHIVVMELRGVNDDMVYGADTVAVRIHRYFGVEEQVTESNEWHTCPYAEEIHGDYETLCDCDEEQAYQCSRDI